MASTMIPPTNVGLTTQDVGDPTFVGRRARR
jgi:hypothetical protein